MARERQEHVVEGRPPEQEVVDGDTLVAQPAHRLHDRAAVFADTEPHHRPVGNRRLGRHRSERPHRCGQVRLGFEPNLETLPADLGFQLVGRSVGDQAPVVDDRDPARQPVGLFEIMRRRSGGRVFGGQELQRPGAGAPFISMLV